MANEITAEELARKMAWMRSRDPVRWPPIVEDAELEFAELFLPALAAHAALMAERAKDASYQCGHPWCGPTCGSPKDAPERVRCWAWEYDGRRHITFDEEATQNLMDGITITEGYFTAKGSTDGP